MRRTHVRPYHRSRHGMSTHGGLVREHDRSSVDTGVATMSGIARESAEDEYLNDFERDVLEDKYAAAERIIESERAYAPHYPEISQWAPRFVANVAGGLEGHGPSLEYHRLPPDMEHEMMVRNAVMNDTMLTMQRNRMLGRR